MLHIFFFLLGIFLLYIGGEWVLKGSTYFARSIGIRPVVIGLTIVAFGTTAPEFAVSFTAALRKESGLAFGNAIGSCITNICLVLGLSSLISAVKIEKKTIKRELSFLLVSTVILFLMSMDLCITRIEGFILIAIFCCVTLFNIRVSVKESKKNNKTNNKGFSMKNTLFIAGGLLGLVGGALLVVKEALFFAEKFNISKTFVGLTIVALGTSLPELWLAVISAIKKEQDVSLGNIIGANTFNILLIVGLVASINSFSLDGAILYIDFPVLLIFSLLLYPFMKTGLILSRLEGGILLAGYIGFILLRVGTL